VPVSYATDIRPLFRDRDVQAMKQFGAFDLSVHEDVVANADGILERLRDGSMPCNGAWPTEQIDRFSQWIADGKLP
jgi:hypothetical protein